jgi:hypothetical protein
MQPKIIRDIEKVDAEYDKDKYAKLLSYFNEHPDTTAEELRRIEKDYPDMCRISIARALYNIPSAQLYKLENDILIKELANDIRQVDVIVELGCGWGYNLSVLKDKFPDKLYLGGELSQNAITLAGKYDIKVSQFNWYDDKWEIIESLTGKALVVTRHSIEQLPTSRDVIPKFFKYRKHIASIVHFEPVYEFNNNHTSLDAQRRLYTLRNDYNKDLFYSLKDVNIIRIKSDILGSNPLNPTSLIQWQF